MRRATVFSLLVLFVVLGCSSAGSAKTYVYDLDETYSIAPDGTLHLDTDDAEVTIVGEDRTDVKVVVHHEWHISGMSSRGGDDFEMVVTESDGDLRIREADTDGVSIIMGSIREDYTVDIHAPKTVNLRLKGDDDDYRIRNFSGNVRLDFEDGRAQLLEMSGTHFELGVEDGDIMMEGGSGLLDMYAEDGSIVVEDGAFDDLNGDVEDGEIIIYTSLADNGTYRMRAEDGDIELNVLDGGGESRLEFDDGGTRVSRHFDLVDKDDYFEEYTLPGGTAMVRMDVEDGHISLRSRK